MSSNIWVQCPNCKGRGKIDDTLQDLVICPTCKGKGIISEITGLPPGEIEDVTIHPFTIPTFPNTSPSVVPQYPWYINPNITCQYVGSADLANGKDDCSVSLLKIDEEGNVSCEFTQNCGNDFLQTVEDIISKYVNKDIKNN